MASGEATGSECLSSYTSCDKHKDEQIEKFCITHKVPICKLCEITDHNACNKVTINDISQQTNQKVVFGAYLHMFINLEEKIKTLKSEQETNKTTLLSKLQECHEEIQDMRKQINAHFDKLDKNLTAAINGIEKDLLAAGENRIKACAHSIREMEKEIQKLQAFESTDDHEIMFVGRAKSLLAFKSYTKTYNNLETDSMLRYPDVLFNAKIFELFRDLLEMGQVVERSQLDTSPSDSHWTNSATFLSNGRLLTSSMPPTLCLYGANGKMLSSVEADLFEDLVAVSDSMVAGTVPRKRQIRFIDIHGNTIGRIRKVRTDRPCYGIGVLNDNLYVTCHDRGTVLGDGELVIMTMDAKPLLRCSRSSIGKSLFIQPGVVCINKTDSTIFVVDSSTQKITRFSADGQNITQLKVDIPLNSRGLCIDGQGRLFVAFKDSICIVNKERIVSKLSTSGYYPYCVDYRESDGALFVGSYGIGSQLFWSK